MLQSLISSSPAFFLSLPLLIASYFYCLFNLPKLPPKGITFDNIVTIDSIKLISSRYGERYLIYGHTEEFPLTFTLQKKDVRLLKKAKALHLKGVLNQKGVASYSLKVGKNEKIDVIESAYSIPWFKYQIKEKLQKSIDKLYQDENCSSLISALLLGISPKPHLTEEFARFGLQHLLAISGFHYGLLSLFICLILSFFCPHRWIAPISIVLMTLYSYLIDFGPSVVRAWITFICMQGVFLFKRESTGLNRLGVALIITLLFDYTYCVKPGFQFSFAVTFAILMLYPLIDQKLALLMTPIKHLPLRKISLLDKQALILLLFFRKLIALSIAVQFVSIPLALYWFQKFPLLSLLYNLFFPLLIGWSLMLFILGILLFPLGPLIHGINELLLKGLLNTFSLPRHRDIFIEVEPFSTTWIALYMLSFFILTLYLSEKESQRAPLLEFY